MARREHTEQELRIKLKKAGFEDPVIASVVERLQEKDWLSDERFAELFVGQRYRKGYGERDIAAKLASRGVERRLASRALAAFVAEENVSWPEHALSVLCSRFGVEPADAESREQASEQPTRKRWAGFLQRRGFSDDQVIRALREFGA